ncbi:hypothetical protein ABD76_19960 [Paenibacillus dendritiformis]|uniref:hypothetical protein n=1 Tax=Paenibacillus dendritiformis TaxID=130049 RepID=UPI001F5563CF|nr:hypothetical protein [Paenibacillus dendritiformis]MBG9794639.1 hypothetical protein [Paenibacillus dendritiformis]
MVQMKIYESRDEAAKLLPISFDEWESKAKSLLAAAPFGYVHGAAGAGDTNRSNVEAFRNYRIRPSCSWRYRDGVPSGRSTLPLS